MSHATCPRCGEVGYVINQESTTELEPEHDSDEITVCYGDFGVVVHG